VPSLRVNLVHGTGLVQIRDIYRLTMVLYSYTDFTKCYLQLYRLLRCISVLLHHLSLSSVFNQKHSVDLLVLLCFGTSGSRADSYCTGVLEHVTGESIVFRDLELRHSRCLNLVVPRLLLRTVENRRVEINDSSLCQVLRVKYASFNRASTDCSNQSHVVAAHSCRVNTARFGHSSAKGVC